MSLLARKLVRDLRRQWAQFAGVAVTLALGIAVFGAAFDSYDNLRTSYDATYRRLGFADAVVTGGDTGALAIRVGHLDGVSAVTVRRQVDAPLRIDTDAGQQTLLGRLVGLPASGDATVDRILVQEGTRPDPARADEIVAERHMADHFDLEVGDTLEVHAGTWRTLRIVGIGVSPEYLWPARDRQDLLTSADDFGVAFAPDAMVGGLGIGGTSGQVLIRYLAGASDTERGDLDRQIHALAERSGASDVMVRADQPSNVALQEDVEAFRELALLFPLLFLVAGGLASYVLLGRLVRTQRGVIGMLAANGFPARRLLLHYLAYGAIVGLAGSVVGAGGGLLLGRWLTHTYTSSLGIPLAVTRVRLLTPLIGVAVGVIAGLLATIGPARSALAVPPAEAMRGTAPTGVAHRSLAEHLPGAGSLPVRGRLMLRNLGRNRRRSLSTGAGVVVAAVLVLSSLGMLDSVRFVIDRQFHEIQREDAQVFLAGRPDPSVVAAIDATPGVARSESSVNAPVVLARDGHRYQTRLVGLEPGTEMHQLPRAVPAEGLLLGSALRSILGLEPGGTVQVVVGDGEPVTMPVAGFVDEPLGSLAYTSVTTAERLAGDDALHSLLVRYTAGASADAMRHRLVDQPGVVAFRDVRGNEQAVERLFELLDAIVGAMLLFGSVLAFVVLLNTLSVNMAERTVELTTLRAAGGRLATLGRLVTGENLLLVAAALPCGLVAGWLVGRMLMSSFDTDLYHFDLHLDLTSPLLVVAALLGLALLMHVPVRRRLARLDIARVVRERAI